MNNFFEWYNYEATEADKALFEKVCKFEHLFDDMLFRPETITGKYVTYTTVDDELWEENPDELEYFSLENYRFKVKKIKGGFAGQYNQRTKTFYIDPECLNDDSTILHEMIHLYEHFINTFFFPLHDACILSLYKELSTKISDLDK